MGWFKKKQENTNEHGFINIEVKPLIEWNEPNGEGCIASNKITKEGWCVGYMYRDEPTDSYPDSGWRFFKGDEDDAYSNDASNHNAFQLNTICNYDPAIIPYLHSPIGTYLIRTKDRKFIIDDGTQEIYIEKQDN